MSRNFIKKQTRKYNTFRILAMTIFITFIAVGTLYGVQRYNNPMLEGKWESIQTGQIIEFTKEGTVLLKDTNYVPKYEVVSPNKIEYSIDDKNFTMDYVIAGRTLMWGMEGQELEEFIRK